MCILNLHTSDEFCMALIVTLNTFLQADKDLTVEILEHFFLQNKEVFENTHIYNAEKNEAENAPKMAVN